MLNKENLKITAVKELLTKSKHKLLFTIKFLNLCFKLLQKYLVLIFSVNSYRVLGLSLQSINNDDTNKQKAKKVIISDKNKV